ncbi:MAG TPA: LytTR family DNA-binding domain-containing protein [Burkholderiales bacterium]|nr:LytTR family DNA-binding domain-containing protein [Burkholderiales bacterium]
MSGLRIFIADDEAPARARLKELLADIGGELACTVAGEAGNGLEVIDRLPGSGAQVLLLDIQMPGMSGIEVARHLGTLEHAPAVVFVTAHDRHAVAAFELNALDYLMKPVRAERLAAALRKALAAGPAPRERLERAASAAREYFSVAERSRIVLVPVAEVIYLKAELKYVTLRTRAGEHLIEEPLVAIEREFGARFVRVHRNCLVARAAIRGFERAAGSGEEEPHWNVVLEGVAERLPVSRRQWPAVKGVLTEGKE